MPSLILKIDCLFKFLINEGSEFTFFLFDDGKILNLQEKTVSSE